MPIEFEHSITFGSLMILVFGFLGWLQLYAAFRRISDRIDKLEQREAKNGVP